ncbi:MAG: hypothetical protein K2O06_13140 [Acetatifactor sp.]|nr:hypothetical protein [Acetatifactor sp.]
MKYWYQKSLRFLQTVLREPDIQNYDAKAVVDYMQKANANTLVINGGGVIDFFPNPLELNKLNQFMGGKDILKDVCQEIHKAGMHVIVRVDFRGVEKERFERHPDWFGKRMDGKPMRSGVAGFISAPCYNSYYANEHAVELIRYLFEHYDFDGVWENAATFGMGPCYCERCRSKYRKETGQEVPEAVYRDEGAVPVNYLDREFDSYRKWKEQCAFDHIERLRRTVKSFGEDKAFAAEIFDLYNSSTSKLSGISHRNAREQFDFLISCVFPDSISLFGDMFGGGGREYDTINNAATVIRFSRSLEPSRQPVICTGGNGTKFRYVKSPYVENRLWMWEIAGAGGSVWNNYFNGQCPAAAHDRRAAWIEKDVNAYLAENEELIADSVPVMDVAIYYSPATRDQFADRDDRKDLFSNQIRGAERVLIERHIPYGFVVGDESFCLEKLKGVKAVLLPNAALLSDQEAAILTEYVKAGGGLVASFESSLYDQEGKRRTDFGLAEVFGCHYTGESVAAGNDSYFLIKQSEHEILKDIGETQVIMAGGRTAVVRSEKEMEEMAGYIPVIPNQPPEYAWRESLESPYAGIIVRKEGAGRVVYFAHTIDRECFLNGHEDYTEIYGNAIDYVTGGSYHIRTDAFRSVHCSLVRNENSFVLSLINTTGTQQRPIKELVPVKDVRVWLNIPEDADIECRVLWGEAVFERDRDSVLVKVPGLTEFVSVSVTVKKLTERNIL